jgi:hypothetical protein
MNEPGKITVSHRRRSAATYVRQSTLAQVERNKESTARQYDLVARARQLGWPANAIRVIDGDLAPRFTLAYEMAHAFFHSQDADVVVSMPRSDHDRERFADAFAGNSWSQATSCAGLPRNWRPLTTWSIQPPSSTCSAISASASAPSASACSRSGSSPGTPTTPWPTFHRAGFARGLGYVVPRLT